MESRLTALVKMKALLADKNLTFDLRNPNSYVFSVLFYATQRLGLLWNTTITKLRLLILKYFRRLQTPRIRNVSYGTATWKGYLLIVPAKSCWTGCRLEGGSGDRLSRTYMTSDKIGATETSVSGRTWTRTWMDRGSLKDSGWRDCRITSLTDGYRC